MSKIIFTANIAYEIEKLLIDVNDHQCRINF